MLVGLPYCYFFEHKNFTPTVYNFWLNAVPLYRRMIMNFPVSRNTFIDTTITQVYQTYEKYDFELHFATWKEIFAHRKIVLVSGKGVLDKLQYNLLEETAECVKYIYAPSKHAFSKLAEIVSEVIKYPAEYVVCLILGPTANPIAADLTRRGYIACDIGHLLKDYDAYMNHTERSEENVANFYKPD